MDHTELHKAWEQGQLIAPAVNIYDTGEKFILKAHLPGVNKESVDVEYLDGELLIYAKAPSNSEVQAYEFVHREIEDGDYYRVFKVSDIVDVGQISAKMDNGVLTLSLPRYERLKPKEIPIDIK